MEFVTLHGDIFSEILVSIHSCGKLTEGERCMRLGNLWVEERKFLNSSIFTISFCAVNNWFTLKLNILSKVEFISFHGDIFSEIFISVHACGEKLLIRWSTSDSRSSKLSAS